METNLTADNTRHVTILLPREREGNQPSKEVQVQIRGEGQVKMVYVVRINTQKLVHITFIELWSNCFLEGTHS